MMLMEFSEEVERILRGLKVFDEEVKRTFNGRGWNIQTKLIELSEEVGGTFKSKTNRCYGNSKELSKNAERIFRG